jgi:ATP-dependent RNA helicase DeaD
LIYLLFCGSLNNTYFLEIFMTELTKFKELGLSDETLKAISEKGFEEPTTIQKLCIPLLLKDKIDVVGQAQTGTGKTAAFGLPIIELVNPDINKVQALILTPTRELAIQIAEELNSLKGDKKLKVAAIYGGQFIGLQIRRLREGAQIIIGTPGRVIDHIERKTLDLSNLSFFILDEADEMLNMGFIDEVENIINHTPKKKRTLLFSATMPRDILKLVKKYMPDYEYVEAKSEALTANLTDQIYFEVNAGDKFETLCRIIDLESEFYGLIFCRTKIDVDMVFGKLVDRGYSAEGIHGDISQNQREKTFARFKSKKFGILVATDVAARGIDVTDLSHVVNYSLPQDSESYVHRIGRTGRAGKEGTAITFITPYEYRKLMFISRGANASIRKALVPEIKDIIKAKKKKIVSQINDIIADSENKSFDEFAKEILADNSPEKVIAALLKHSFNNELDESGYNEIQEAGQASVDNTGKNRLFIGMGSRNGMTKKKIVDFITQKAGIKGSIIDGVGVYDDFSFVTVPFKEAEIILNAFKDFKKGKRPMIQKAKAKR